jgi:hypothetical protein
MKLKKNIIIIATLKLIKNYYMMISLKMTIIIITFIFSLKIKKKKIIKN